MCGRRGVAGDLWMIGRHVADYARRIVAPDTRAMQALLDVLLAATCPGCGREGSLLCATCRRSVERRLAEPPGAPIGLPFDLPAGLLQLEWCASFTGVTRSALHSLKYDGERRLAQPLGGILAERWRRAGAGGEVLVPVPVHAERLRARGYDQAVLLAHATGAALGIPVSPALRRVQATQAQYRLGRSGRAANVGHAFEVTPSLRGTVRERWVILVDDVVTTGSTLGACARALRVAGAAAVSAMTVARER